MTQILALLIYKQHARSILNGGLVRNHEGRSSRQPDRPQVTQPQVTQPQVTQPQVTQPQVTQPQVTQPQVTLADLQTFVTQPLSARLDELDGDVADMCSRVANLSNAVLTFDSRLVKVEKHISDSEEWHAADYAKTIALVLGSAAFGKVAYDVVTAPSQPTLFQPSGFLPPAN